MEDIAAVCDNKSCFHLMKFLTFAVAPHIHREDVEDITVNVGQSLRFTIHIDGEPPPKLPGVATGDHLIWMLLLKMRIILPSLL